MILCTFECLIHTCVFWYIAQCWVMYQSCCMRFRLLANSVSGVCYCVHLFQHAPSSQSPTSPHQTTNKEEAEQAWRPNHKKPAAGLSRGSNLSRSGSVKNLISIFSGPSSGTQQRFSPGTLPRATSTEALYISRAKSSPSTLSKVEKDDASVPSITVTPPSSQKVAMKGSFNSQIAARIDCPVDVRAEKTASVPLNKTQTKDSARDSVADSGMGSVSKTLNVLADRPFPCLCMKRKSLDLPCMETESRHDIAVFQKCMSLHD